MLSSAGSGTGRLIQKYRLGFTGRRLSHAGAIEAMDAAIGRILATLKSEGMERDTPSCFFVITVPAKPPNAAVRSRSTEIARRQRHTREGGIRVPAVMRWPATISLVPRQINLWAFRICYPHWRPWRQFLETRQTVGWRELLAGHSGSEPIERPPVIVGGEGGGFVLDGK